MKSTALPPSSTLSDATSVHGTGLRFIHIAIIALSLVMTVTAWQFSKNQIETRTAARFDVERDQVIGLITARMRKYEDALWSGASTVESHGGDISYEAWRSFAHTLRIEEKYPGISGIGVIHYVSEAEVPAYLAARGAERPGFRMHPEHDQPFHIPISFIEPEGPNAKAVGLDLAFEINRRTAALASRESGEARITGPIVLVQDAGSTPGFLFYVPFHSGQDPEVVAGRSETVVGGVYAPFVTRKLMEGLLAKELRGVRFSIVDDGEMIFDEHDTDDPLNDPNPMFSETLSLDLYGRTWTLDMRSNLAFRETNSYAQPTFILFGGLVIEALIISLLVMMAKANGRAVAYADRMTVALKDESEKLAGANRALSGKNEELEQFAYVTSHDLKTPIRGIGGLTEMVQDDLEDYLASPDANPAVAANLQRIRDRVRRMNDLTGGIMEFSRLGRDGGSANPVGMAEIVDALRSDFALSDSELSLDDAGASVTTDTFSFRRVIENLVGNAIKYHDDPENMAVAVSSRIEGERLVVSVADDGPGIDPDYHDRIFEIFQTLRTGDAPESTGIGLAIVKKAVENHGGRIAVSSAPGEGATFTFDWPVAIPTDAPIEVRHVA